MHAIPPSTIVPNLVIGPIVIVAGILITVFRVKVRNWSVRGQSAIIGQKRSEAATKLQTPFWIGVVGVMAALMGVLALTGAIVGLVQVLSS